MLVVYNLTTFWLVSFGYFLQKLSWWGTKVLSDWDKKKEREIPSSPDAIDYMLSEESCEDNNEAVEQRSGPKPQKIRRLSWEKSKLTNIEAKLDKAYLAQLTERQNWTSAVFTCTEEKSPPPHQSQGPHWAVHSE